MMRGMVICGPMRPWVRPDSNPIRFESRQGREFLGLAMILAAGGSTRTLGILIPSKAWACRRRLIRESGEWRGVVRDVPRPHLAKDGHMDDCDTIITSPASPGACTGSGMTPKRRR